MSFPPKGATPSVNSAGNTTGLVVPGGTIPIRANQFIGSLVGGNSPLPATTDSMITGAGTIRCYNFAIGVGLPFNSFKFLYANFSTTVPALIDNACGGTSSTAYPGGVFNIALPESNWTAPTGSTAGPVAFSTKCPAVFASPEMIKTSIPRAAGELDGGTGELVFGRVVQLAANVAFPFSTLGAGFPAYWDAINQGVSVLVGNPYFGDAVTSPASFTTSVRADSPAIPIIGIIPNYDKKVTTFGEVFDSIGAGLASAGDRMRAAPSFMAVARIRNAGKFVAFQQSSISGATMPDIVQHVKDLSTAGYFNVLIISPYTSNSAIDTQAAWDTQWYQMMTAIRFHLAQNSQNTVVLKTPLPMNSLTVAQNGYRVKCLARVRAAGYPYVDLESLADSLGHWAVAGDTSDGTHETAQGREKVAVLSQPVFDSVAP